MVSRITYKLYGERAILIEWKPEIDIKIIQEIHNFKIKIEQQKGTEISDFIIAYHSLTIIYKKSRIDFKKEVEVLQEIWQLKIIIPKIKNFLWEIPVCYHPDLGIDLLEMSNELNLDVEAIITLHSDQIYDVYFIGFLPGFLYLGGLHPKLYFNRKSNPRLQVSQGSVAIGGKQTGVYPANSAGGWNIIGKTPVCFFNVHADKPCFAKLGDKIKFTPISLDAYDQLKKEIQQNTFQLSKALLND